MDEKYKEFLDELRESGSVNMFGARPILAQRFGLDKNESGKILTQWMEEF